MSAVIGAEEALGNSRTNGQGTWNRSKSSSERSENAEDASNRIFDGFAKLRAAYTGPKLDRGSRIFAMGSCFAREIERSLARAGGNVISVDRRIDRPEFFGRGGEARNGFFHRFTPFAMLQEFQQAFGEAPGWTEKTLLLENGDEVIDLNYWDVTDADASLEATLIRRRVAAELVREAASADLVILTLGFTESWFHKPSGFHANKVPGPVLVRRRGEFELRMISYAETLACLAEIRSLIQRHRSTPFQMVVTVSPVPLSRTFTADDMIVANMNSKSTLRAAAGEFCRLSPDIHYFPSYEMATYSDPNLAWRPDRVHVQPQMVLHIVRTFTDTYYAAGALTTE